MFFSLCIFPATLWAKEALIKIIKRLIKTRMSAELGLCRILEAVLKIISGLIILKAKSRIKTEKNMKNTVLNTSPKK